VAFDSTPSDMPAWTDPTQEPARQRRLPRRRTILIALALMALVMSGFVVSGIADAAEHALAHAFPGLMVDGCGGG
jgi:hypothetical protein